MDERFMFEAVKEAQKGIRFKHGGPFGAVIVKDGEIIGRGHNQVLKKHDPTCHGEIMAIQDACKNNSNHDLQGSAIYTTAYPCPMCLGAIYWAHISDIYYGCDLEETSEIGFSDQELYARFQNHTSLGERCGHQECAGLFKEYAEGKNKRY